MIWVKNLICILGIHCFKNIGVVDNDFAFHDLCSHCGMEISRGFTHYGPVKILKPDLIILGKHHQVHSYFFEN